MQLPSEIDPKDFNQHYRHQPNLWRSAIEETSLLNNIVPDRFEPFPGGSNLIASVTEECIVKIFPPFHRHQWTSEYMVLSQLNGKVNVPIPELIASGEREDRWTYVIISKLPGITMDNIWEQCTHDEKIVLIRTIGEMMNEVHKVPVGNLVTLEPEWNFFLDQQMKKFMDRHRRFGMPDWFLSEADSFVRDAASLLPFDAEPVILTGEYTPFNIMVKGSPGRWTISGMIDFGDSMIGYHEYDLLGPIMFLAAGDSQLIQSFLKGYGYSDDHIDKNLRRRMMLLQILHRFSNFNGQLRISDWQNRVTSIVELEQLIWPFDR